MTAEMVREIDRTTDENRRSREWEKRAACADWEIMRRNECEPDDFHPITSGGRPGPLAVLSYDRAKSVCRLCPVRQECLDAHLDEPHGVWGGLDPAQRREAEGRTGSYYRPHPPGTGAPRVYRGPNTARPR